MAVLPPVGLTTADRPQLSATGRSDEDDEVADELGEEEDKDLEVNGLQGCGECGKAPKALARVRAPPGLSPSLNPAHKPPSRPSRTSAKRTTAACRPRSCIRMRTSSRLRDCSFFSLCVTDSSMVVSSPPSSRCEHSLPKPSWPRRESL